MLNSEFVLENAGEMYLEKRMKREGIRLEDLQGESPEEMWKYGIHSEQLRAVVFILCRVINEKVMAGFKKRDERIARLEEKFNVLSLEGQELRKEVDGIDDDPVVLVDKGDVEECAEKLNKLWERVVGLEERERERGLG